jgi:hypothetical protein
MERHRVVGSSVLGAYLGWGKPRPYKGVGRCEARFSAK